MLIQPHTMHLFYASAYQEQHNHKYQRYLSFMLRNLICKQKLTENFKYLCLESENLSPTFTMSLGRTKVFRPECHLTPPVNSVAQQQQLIQSVSDSKRPLNKWKVWGFAVMVLPRLPGRSVLVPSCSAERFSARPPSPRAAQRRTPLGGACGARPSSRAGIRPGPRAAAPAGIGIAPRRAVPAARQERSPRAASAHQVFRVPP